MTETVIVEAEVSADDLRRAGWHHEDDGDDGWHWDSDCPAEELGDAADDVPGLGGGGLHAARPRPAQPLHRQPAQAGLPAPVTDMATNDRGDRP